MAIALFDRNFPRVSLSSPALPDIREGLLIGVVANQAGDEIAGLVILPDGELSLLGLQFIQVAYKYDVESDRWLDTNAPEMVLEGLEPDQE